jgi:tRNA U34 5-methylaminomethyl-2-thiouridine-forming methyltransferase MnmC
MIRAEISAESDPLRQPSSTITARRVLPTEAMIVASSSGRSVRRSMTSALIPSAASASAASSVLWSDPP